MSNNMITDCSNCHSIASLRIRNIAFDDMGDYVLIKSKCMECDSLLVFMFELKDIVITKEKLVLNPQPHNQDTHIENAHYAIELLMKQKGIKNENVTEKIYGHNKKLK